MNEFHDFRDFRGQMVAIVVSDGKVYLVEISRHSCVKTVVLDESKDFSHIVNRFGTGHNCYFGFSGHKVLCEGCSHGKTETKGFMGLYSPKRNKALQPYGLVLLCMD